MRMQSLKNLSLVRWLVNSHWDKLGGASSNEHQRKDKQQPSIYLLSSCHSNNVSFMTLSTFAASWHACLTLLVAIFLSNSNDGFGVQEFYLFFKRLQVVRTPSDQGLTSPVFLKEPSSSSCFLVGIAGLAVLLPWKTTSVERLDHKFRGNNGLWRALWTSALLHTDLSPHSQPLLS